MSGFGEIQGVFFWGFLIVFGALMFLLAPCAGDESGFFSGHDEQGRPASEWALTMSIFISWIFAKSVTNAANLGAAYGVVGGLAYAAYWLSIPLAGLVIHRLRTREGARGLVSFLAGKYGRGAAPTSSRPRRSAVPWGSGWRRSSYARAGSAIRRCHFTWPSGAEWGLACCSR